MITGAQSPDHLADGVPPAAAGTPAKGRLRHFVLAFSRLAIVLVLIVIGAGNITNSFFLKWGFRDEQKNYTEENYRQSYSLVGMMYGEAARPFVYRSAVPRAIRWAVDRVDPALRAKAFAAISQNDSLRKTYFHHVPPRYWTQEVSLTYHATYLFIVGVIVLMLFTVYRIARLHGFGWGESMVFVAAFSLFYPLTFQQGGYFYDFVEQLGVLSAVWFTLRGRMLPATLTVLLFSLNKETFFLVPLALFFLADRLPMRQRAAWLLAQLVCCAVGRYAITSGFQGNPGGDIETHWAQNLAFWINPASWLLFYNLVGKGIYTPSLQNPLLLVPLVVFFRAAWRKAPRNYRNYFHAAFWPLLLLFLLFGYADEARNFSLAFPALMLIALYGVRDFDRIFAAPKGDQSRQPTTLPH